MSTVDQKVDLFTDTFSKVALTLIAKLAEINESLDRISSDTELLAKIKIQLAENMKQSSSMEKHINALNLRLDKLGIGGLGMPTVGVPPSPPPTGAAKPIISNSKSEDSFFSMPAPHTAADKDGSLKDDLKGLDFPPVPSPAKASPLTPRLDFPPVPSPAKASPLTPLPQMPKPKGAKDTPLISAPDPMATLTALPAKPVPRVPTSNLPFLQVKDGGNPTFVIIQNLSKEVNELGASEEIGKAFLRAKDLLTAQIKFHPALFDLIKFGNDYIRKKPAVDAAFRAEVLKKIEELYRKFGGT